MEKTKGLLLSQARALKSLLYQQKTISVSEVPPLFREPSILTGYRISGQPWIYYFLSLFQIHNETLNIWTHLLAFLAVVYKLGSTYAQLADYTDYQCVILGFGVCCMFYTFLSSLAHTIHTKSDFIHYNAYHSDFAGIGFYMLGTSINLYYASCHAEYYPLFEKLFLPVVVILSWFGCFCSCVAKLKYRRPYPFRRKLWNIGSFGIQVVSVFSLVGLRYYDCVKDSECTLTSLNHHTRVVVLVLLSMFFFCSHLPERLSPGRFDILGFGHQIFHVVIAIATIEQFNTAVEDITGYTHKLVTHKPDTFCIYGAIFVYGVVSSATVVMLTHYVRKRIQNDQEIQKRQKND